MSLTGVIAMGVRALLGLLLLVGCGRTLLLPFPSGSNGGTGGNFVVTGSGGNTVPVGGGGSGFAGGGFSGFGGGGLGGFSGFGGGGFGGVGGGGTGGIGPGECYRGDVTVCICPNGGGVGKTRCQARNGGYGFFGPCEGCVLPPPPCGIFPDVGLPPGCQKTACACDPKGAINCDKDCWSLVACVARNCGANATDTNCIIDNCTAFLNSASQAMALFSGPCAMSLRAACVGVGSYCGDGVRNEGESCDGGDFGGLSCASLGYGGGPLRCTSSCSLDTSGCSVGYCGDGKIQGSEACDGTDFGGATCRTYGFPSGQLACNGCRAVDTSKCTQCGDGVIEAGESCDGENLGGVSCIDLGFSGGMPSCSGCAFDTTNCSHCGNGVIEPGERCDGSALGGQSCATLGLGDGTLGCDPLSCLFDTRACATGPRCGNGIVEAGEACDGKDLLGLDCQQLGFASGQLACNQQTCRFDTSGCQRTVPIGDCAKCGSSRCSASIEACTSQMQCIGGLSCLGGMCGSDPQLSCALSCFGGDTNAGLTALSMFGCIVNQCGPECVGAF